MSAIEYIKHDVTNTQRGVVAHGCNCHGVMGSGVAKAIRAKWVVAYERYRAFVESTWQNDIQPRELLGLCQIVNVGHPWIDINTLFVANCFTQVDYGKDGAVYADLAAIEESLRVTMGFCRAADLPLYLPQIGCGLGGLKWDSQVGPIVEQLQAEFDIKVFVCDI